MTKIFHKLVRDKIPQIIKASGATPTTRILNDDEFRAAVDAKIREEAAELAEAKTREDVLKELADVKQICLAKADLLGIAEAEIEVERIAREKSRGGFRKKIFLIETDKDTR